jgi:hypothetical protein
MPTPIRMRAPANSLEIIFPSIMANVKYIALDKNWVSECQNRNLEMRKYCRF